MPMRVCKVMVRPDLILVLHPCFSFLRAMLTDRKRDLAVYWDLHFSASTLQLAKKIFVQRR